MLPTPARPADPASDQLLSVTTLAGTRLGHPVLEVTGEVDACTAPVLELCLRSQAGRPGVRELVVDLRGVTFLGVAGVAVLARIDRLCRSRGARLVVRTGGLRTALRPLELTGLTVVVAVDPAAEERLSCGVGSGATAPSTARSRGRRRGRHPSGRRGSEG